MIAIGLLFVHMLCDCFKSRQRLEAEIMILRHHILWGTRGSLAKPGRITLRHGGNTSCVEVRGDDGTLIVLVRIRQRSFLTKKLIVPSGFSPKARAIIQMSLPHRDGDA